MPLDQASINLFFEEVDKDTCYKDFTEIKDVCTLIVGDSWGILIQQLRAYPFDLFYNFLY